VEQPDFAQGILQARRAENAEKRYEQAADLYRELSDNQLPSKTQRVYARFLLAATLVRSGKGTAALSIHRDLLKLPSTIVDDQGVPFA
jgi:hypothetical protein